MPIPAGSPTSPQAYAYYGDVAVELGRVFDDAQTARAVRLLDLASRTVRAQVRDVDARIAAGTLDPALVAGVVVQMVARVMRAEPGLRSHSQTIGPMTDARTYDTSSGDGLPALTAAELALLAPLAVAGTRPAGIGTIQLSSPFMPSRWAPR